MTAIQRVLDALTANGSTPRKSGSGWMARCPCHDDSTASLSISNGDGRVLLHDHAGCDYRDIVAAIKLTEADLFDEPFTTNSKPTIVATYDYIDEQGTFLFQVVRLAPKNFKQRRPDGKGGWIWKLEQTRRVLYRLPQVIEAVKNGDTIYVTEGEKDAHAIEAMGGTSTCNPGGAGKWRAEYAETLVGADVVVVADKDQVGRDHAQTVADSLKDKAASVRIVEPASGKDADDHRSAGYDLEQFVPFGSPAPVTVDQCHAVFRRWFGDEYDLDVLDVVLCTLAVERLDGDPLWLLVISGPGAAKTETVQASAGAGAFVTSTVSSDAALLSGSPRRDKAKDATGGLLRRIGDDGVLVIKDVTSILSANRDSRATVLAAMREIYDGYWERNLGVDGGRSLSWRGRLAVIGAVTTAWDTAHSVVSTMGDRFVLVRLDSTTGRHAAGLRTAANTGDEITMRAELATAVGGVLAGINSAADLSLTVDEITRLLSAADLVTLARTGVEYDYKGDVTDAHAPEMPTRYLRQLQQIIRGGIALGMNRDHVLRLAIRCARDSMPPVRLAIIDDLAKNPRSTPSDIRRRVDLPWRTVDRQCQALHMLGVVAVDEVEYGETGKSRWYYALGANVDTTALQSSPDLSLPPPSPPERDPRDTPPEAPPGGGSDISGEHTLQVNDACCGNPLDYHAAPECPMPTIHRPPDLWSVT